MPQRRQNRAFADSDRPHFTHGWATAAAAAMSAGVPLRTCCAEAAQRAEESGCGSSVRPARVVGASVLRAPARQTGVSGHCGSGRPAASSAGATMSHGVAPSGPGVCAGVVGGCGSGATGVGQVGCGTTSTRGSGSATAATGSGSAATGSGSTGSGSGCAVIGSGAVSAATGSGSASTATGSGSTSCSAGPPAIARSSAASMASSLTGAGWRLRSAAGHARSASLAATLGATGSASATASGAATTGSGSGASATGSASTTASGAATTGSGSGASATASGSTTASVPNAARSGACDGLGLGGLGLVGFGFEGPVRRKCGEPALDLGLVVIGLGLDGGCELLDLGLGDRLGHRRRLALELLGGQPRLVGGDGVLEALAGLDAVDAVGIVRVVVDRRVHDRLDGRVLLGGGGLGLELGIGLGHARGVDRGRVRRCRRGGRDGRGVRPDPGVVVIERARLGGSGLPLHLVGRDRRCLDLGFEDGCLDGLGLED